MAQIRLVLTKGTLVLTKMMRSSCRLSLAIFGESLRQKRDFRIPEFLSKNMFLLTQCRRKERIAGKTCASVEKNIVDEEYKDGISLLNKSENKI